jgi:hypothetical protein
LKLARHMYARDSTDSMSCSLQLLVGSLCAAESQRATLSRHAIAQGCSSF